MVEGSRQRLSDTHQSHFAGRQGKPGTAPLMLDASAEEECSIPGGAPKARLMCILDKTSND
jgi:hypothetical protein